MTDNEEDHGNLPDILTKLGEMSDYAWKLVREQDEWKKKKNILDNCLTPSEKRGKDWAMKEESRDNKRRM